MYGKMPTIMSDHKKTGIVDWILNLKHESLATLIAEKYMNHTGYSKLRRVAPQGLPKSEKTLYPDDAVEG